MRHDLANAVRTAGFVCVALAVLYYVVVTIVFWNSMGIGGAIEVHDLSRWRTWWAYLVHFTPGFLLIVLAELLDQDLD